MSSDISPAQPVVSAEQALEFVARASALLARSLDYETTLRQVARLAVPEVADWCGVLLIEADGEERELSSGYEDPELDAVLREIRKRRRATADASESRRVAQSGEPILATDVRMAIGADVDERQRKLVDRLAPKSYLIVPLPARGRSLGSMTLLSTREGRHYAASDLAFAEALAERCALAIDNAKLHDSAERSLSVLQTVFSSAPVGLALVDRDLSFVRVNETFEAFHSAAVEDEVASAYRHVLDTGESVLDRDLTTESRDGTQRHWNASFTPVPHADGSITSAIVAVIDVTERRALLDAERDARSRADFLARAGSILDESLDYEETLRSVAQIAVPEIADWCAVSILDEAGVLQEVATAHVDSAQRELARELRRRFPPDPESTTGAVAVARSGETQYMRELTDELLAAAIPDPEQLALVRSLGVRSVVIAALKARGRLFGTLTLASAESGRLFERADVQLAEELAARAGMAIDNEVGGDFYDVFPRSRSEWALVVGDVSGKGAEAASVTALARYTLRAAALEDAPPSGALRRLNAAMLDDDTSQFATVALAYFSKAGPGEVDIRLSLAGHPAPAVLRRDGTVEMAGRFGMMVGLGVEPVLHDVELRIGAGDVLLLYTDGVTEAGPRGQPFGEQGVATLLGGLAGQTPQAVVDAVEQAAVAAQPGDPRDDIALLAISAVAYRGSMR